MKEQILLFLGKASKGYMDDIEIEKNNDVCEEKVVD
jgi:hypothetical protein